jgi:hypothetical protein
VVSSPPATEEIEVMGREVGSRQGFKKLNTYTLGWRDTMHIIVDCMYLRRYNVFELLPKAMENHFHWVN